MATALWPSAESLSDTPGGMFPDGLAPPPPGESRYAQPSGTGSPKGFPRPSPQYVRRASSCVLVSARSPAHAAPPTVAGTHALRSKDDDPPLRPACLPRRTRPVVGFGHEVRGPARVPSWSIGAHEPSISKLVRAAFAAHAFHRAYQKRRACSGSFHAITLVVVVLDDQLAACDAKLQFESGMVPDHMGCSCPQAPAT